MALTREYLKELGIEDKSVDDIMREHGKSVQRVQAELEESKTESLELRSQIEARDKDLEELRNDERLKSDTTESQQLQEQIEKLESKYKADTEELNARIAEQRKNAALDVEIVKRGAHNPKTVRALIDISAIQVDDDGVHGVAEQLDKIQEADSYLFKPMNEPTGQATVSGNPGRGASDKKPDAFMTAAEKFTK